MRGIRHWHAVCVGTCLSVCPSVTRLAVIVLIVSATGDRRLSVSDHRRSNRPLFIRVLPPAACSLHGRKSVKYSRSSVPNALPPRRRLNAHSQLSCLSLMYNGDGFHDLSLSLSLSLVTKMTNGSLRHSPALARLDSQQVRHFSSTVHKILLHRGF